MKSPAQSKAQKVIVTRTCVCKTKAGTRDQGITLFIPAEHEQSGNSMNDHENATDNNFGVAREVTQVAKSTVWAPVKDGALRSDLFMSIMWFPPNLCLFARDQGPS